MLRQISNLIHVGRIRTTAPTERAKKPSVLRDNPGLEVDNYLEMALAQLGIGDDDFFFVQIGAFDGLESDHLHQMIKSRHWQGLLIEPQPGAFKQLKQTYSDCPQLKFYNVAIGPEDGHLTLYTRTDGSVPIASVARRLLIKPGHSSKKVVGIEVPCWTFDRLLTESKTDQQIDLLQIDTEGFDFEIIRSIRFDRTRPKIIRYEHALLSENDRNACIKLLCEQGYRILLEDRDTIAIHFAQHAAQAA